jgi:ubiquinone biosynthesis protein UbiJ
MKQPTAELFIRISGGKVRLTPRFEGEATATISGSAAALAALLLKREPIFGLHNSGLDLRGNTGFAQSLQGLLLESRIDWEYQLSRVFGDIPTQLVADGVHKSQEYLQRTARRVSRDISDFLLEEGRLVPATAELEKFYSDVQALSLRLDRLDARLTRYTQHKN